MINSVSFTVKNLVTLAAVGLEGMVGVPLPAFDDCGTVGGVGGNSVNLPFSILAFNISFLLFKI